MSDDYEFNAKFSADTKGFEDSIDKAVEATESFAESFDSIADDVKNGAESWGIDLDKFYQKGSSIFKDFGIDIDKFASHFGIEGKLLSAIVGATVALEKFGEKVQAMSSNIVKGTGATGEALQKLKDSANDALINGVGRSAEEVGKIVADLNTRFGFTGDTLAEMTDKFEKFASVTNSDVSMAVNSVADAIYKWGLSAEDSSDLMNQLLVASQKSGASIDTLLNSVTDGQSIFTQFGMSLTDSIAFTANLEQQGINASTAIMGMRTALAKFSNEGKDAEKEFAKVSEKIRNSKNETEALNIAVETFGNRSGPEMLKVLRNSSESLDDFKNALLQSGLAIEETEEASRTVSDAIDDLKAVLTGTFGGFGEGIANMFKSLIDSITSIIQGIAPIVRPIADIFNEVFTTVGEIIRMFIENLVEFQTKYNYVFQTIADILVQVRDMIRKVLKNVMDIFGDAFGFIFAILEGKWALAWEYAKNAMLKVSDIILKVVSLIINSFTTMVNKFTEKITWIVDVYNKFANSAVGKWLELEEVTGLKIIPEVDLSQITGLTDKIEESNKKIEELSGKSSKKLTSDLAKAQEVSTKFSIMTEKQIAEQLKLQNEATNQRLAWEDKLLQQEMSRIEFEKSEALKEAQRKKESIDAQNKIIDEYNKKQIALYEKIAEKKKEIDLRQAKSEEEKAKIIKYYQDDLANYIDKLNAETLKKQNDFGTKLVNILKKITKKIGSMLSKLFNTIFNSSTDELLDGLLEFEDKILTFFYETLPKLPEFVETVLDSVITIIEDLANNIDFNKVAEIVMRIFNVITNRLPKLMKDLTTVLLTLIQSMLEGLIEWLSTGGLKTLMETALDITLQIFQFLIDNLPMIIKIVINSIEQIVTAVIKALPDFAMAIIKALPSIITTIVQSIWEMIKSAFNAIGSVFTGAWNWIKGIFGWATGTNNAPSGLAIVGEQGPELIDLHGGERIYNANDTREILSGVNSSPAGNTFNVTFNNVEDTSAYTMVRQLKQYNRQMAINGVL